MPRTPPAQLDREIAEALRSKTRKASRKGSRELRTTAKRTPRMHHATVADSWDVAMDAILEHDPEKAHEIVERIRKEHGIGYGGEPYPPSQGFLDALDQVPLKVRARFFELNNAPSDETIPIGRYRVLVHPISPSKGFSVKLISDDGDSRFPLMAHRAATREAALTLLVRELRSGTSDERRIGDQIAMFL